MFLFHLTLVLKIFEVKPAIRVDEWTKIGELMFQSDSIKKGFKSICVWCFKL